MDSNFRLDDYMLEHRNEVLVLDHELGALAFVAGWPASSNYGDIEKVNHTAILKNPLGLLWSVR